MVATRTVVLALAFLTIAVFSPAQVSEGRVDGDFDASDCEPTSAELEDIDFLAEREGVARDEAIARFGWQKCFSAAADHLRNAHPEEFAGAAIVDGGRGAWVAFRGVAPEEARQWTEEIPVSVELVEGRGFSEAELVHALQTTYEDVQGHEEVLAAAGGYDIETGVITIEAQPRDSTLAAAERDRLHKTLQPAEHDNSAVIVEVELVEELRAGVDEEARNWMGSAAVLATALVLALVAGRVVARRHGKS